MSAGSSTRNEIQKSESIIPEISRNSFGTKPQYTENPMRKLESYEESYGTTNKPSTPNTIQLTENGISNDNFHTNPEVTLKRRLGRDYKR